ncbi:MAG: 3'(2'),5'-bisphosphate nucleotidase CysQ [Candidatus Saccharimonadales bacterium]
MNIQRHLDELIAIIHDADKAIMEVYDTHSAVVEMKADNTPLTQADMSSHAILSSGLDELFPDIPIISEEGDQEQNSRMVKDEMFWLVDPLDGTREFVARSGQFCVCVGLIVNGKPYFGIVSVPALGVIYYGGATMGSYKKVGDQPPEIIHVSDHHLGIVLGSRMDKGGPTYDYIADNFAYSEIQSFGSMLKFTMIAEGLADVYPCIQRPLHLWDVAAGHAIVDGAGGTVTRPDGSLIDYNNQTLMAGDFVVSSNS